jgi:hypothetical protein
MDAVDDFSGDKNRRVRHRRVENTRAWADPGGILPVVDCKIIDISEGGAQVEPVNKIEMPDSFMLQIDATRNLGRVDVVWRGPKSVGVKFVKVKTKRARNGIEPLK